MPQARQRSLPSSRPAPRVSQSEIRLRGDDRDTEPSIPARAELTNHEWEALDRTLFFHTTRLESGVRGGMGAHVATAVDAIVADLDLLGVALVELRLCALEPAAMTQVAVWWPCVERVYRWAIDLADTVEDAVGYSGQDRESFFASVDSIASYARLFVYALVDSLVREATGALRATGCDGAVESLPRVQQRALSLLRTVEGIAQGAV